MDKFTTFSGNTDCPKCKGLGYYYYDENHGQICELCCTHPEGFVSLDPEFYGDEAKIYDYCKFGCGFKRPKDVRKMSLEQIKNMPNKNPYLIEENGIKTNNSND
jgi:hypothetical protein